MEPHTMSYGPHKQSVCNMAMDVAYDVATEMVVDVSFFMWHVDMEMWT